MIEVYVLIYLSSGKCYTYTYTYAYAYNTYH